MVFKETHPVECSSIKIVKQLIISTPVPLNCIPNSKVIRVVVVSTDLAKMTTKMNHWPGGQSRGQQTCVWDTWFYDFFFGNIVH